MPAPAPLDWLLFGDDGSVENPTELLKQMTKSIFKGRSHWVSLYSRPTKTLMLDLWHVLPIEDIDEPSLTKSSLLPWHVTERLSLQP